MAPHNNDKEVKNNHFQPHFMVENKHLCANMVSKMKPFLKT